MEGDNLMNSVLIVDDSSFMRTWIKRLIQQNGYLVAGEAANGYEAILEYRKLNPDIVLLDIHMPELMGVEVLRRILAIDPQAKIIMCSATGTTFLIEECLQIGAKDFVKKPHFENLLTIMEATLKT